MTAWTPRRARGVWLAAACIAAVTALAVLAASPRQQPTFRATVDLIAVDVQVVNRDGWPVASISPEKFGVTIDGHQRKVVSVNVVQVAPPSTSPSDLVLHPPAIGPAATNMWPSAGRTGRTFVLAFDIDSFSIGDSRGAVQAARSFVQRLQPNDVVGVYSYPLGPRVDLTTSRATVLRGLDSVVGGSQSQTSQYHLSPAEVIDINAEMASVGSRLAAPTTSSRNATAPTPFSGNETETLRAVQIRECGSETDIRCVEDIEREAQGMAFFYEGQVMQAVTGLSDLLRRLSHYPGRKTVIVFSAGMPVSDRLGGRPTVGDAARMLGEDAARADTNIYALHLDTTFFRSLAAENRSNNKMPVMHERESVMMGRFLDQFAGTSGGTLMRVLVGSGEGALDQILRETSSYYLLGVSPSDADRDGRTHRLRVKVDQKNATIRSRTWVLVPKKTI